MTGPEHYRRADHLAAEAHRLLGQGDGQATPAAGPPLPKPMRYSPWPPPPSAHLGRTTAPGPRPPGWVRILWGSRTRPLVLTWDSMRPARTR
jgi:hypothetical protein